jgi:hypothetical protein
VGGNLSKWLRYRARVCQDVVGVLGPLRGYFASGMVDWDDPVSYSERKLMHVLTLVCAAVDPLFQTTLKRACGADAVWVKAGRSSVKFEDTLFSFLIRHI